ncbi:hypothetical protein Ddye_030915 [Dipteronia dyeriana]|uniref:Glycosyltransferase 61 catalytic domain-containing protein n=1 Tax=Dipteronia dyeriana TaxID=168575 RepID=A0AAD9WN58_9ROSI|nr:hypothetical protein Ddye_030915 [Dipteronia dyeriana]
MDQLYLNVITKKRRRLVKAAVFFTTFVIFFLHFMSITDSNPFQEVRSWKLNNIRRTLSLSSTEAQSGPVNCDRSHSIYDLCSINGPTLLDPTTSTFSSMGPTTNSYSSALLLKTKPYPRKRDKAAMSKVKEVTLTSVPPKLPCGVTHTSPALVFSTGGYIGNFFHQFMDVLIPLFITVNSFFPENRDFILVVSDYQDWWTPKYKDLLPHFTNHPIINMDNETITHCFPSVIVGIVSHGYMIMNPTLLPHPKTLVDFHYLLHNAYHQDHDDRDNIINTRPRLVLVNRKNNVGRVILNLKEVKSTANELGFDVTVFEPNKNTSLVESYRLIHGSHVMLGVHGAALTHFLFLRPGCVLIQVVPIGTQWVSDHYFGKPARVLGLEYMEYKVRLEESSLVEKYGANHLALRDPQAFHGGNWSNMKVYMKDQNIKLDMVRLKIYLKDAYNKAKRFMDNNES